MHQNFKNLSDCGVIGKCYESEASRFYRKNKLFVISLTVVTVNYDDAV